MTSQKSANNKSICLLSLMREDLRHKTWMLALSILGSTFAGPIAFLFYYSSRNRYAYDRLVIMGDKVYNERNVFVMTTAQYYLRKLTSCVDYLTQYYLIFMAVIAFVGALIVAIFGFRYLYHKKMVDLYHSAPVSRRRLFTAIWLNGFLLWFIPALVASLIVFIEAAVYMQGMSVTTLFLAVFKTLLRLTLVFLIVYNASLVPVMLSGNILNAIVGTLTYGFLIASFGILMLFTQHVFYDNFYLPNDLLYFHPLYVLSPLVTPLGLVYHWVSETYDVSSWQIHLIGGSLLMIINHLLAFILYLKRPSELAERGLEARGVRIFSRFALSMISGFACAMIVFTFAGDNVAWMLFGCFIGTLLVFCFMNVIFHGSFKDVFSHKIQYVVVLLTTIFLFATIHYDWTGYDKLLPGKSDLKGLSVYCERLYDTDSRFRMDNGLLVGPVRDYDEPSKDFTYTDPDKIYDFLSACVHSNETEYSGYYYVTVKVKTRWGSYYRSYVLDEDKLSALEPIVESKEYKECYYPVKSAQFGVPSEIELSSSFSLDETIKDPEKIQAFLDCFHRDFEEHGSMKDLMRYSRVFSVYFTYYCSDVYLNSKLFNYDIPYWYENTIRLVESWYPDKKWDPSPEDVASFTLFHSIPVGKDMSIRDAVLNYYGYDENGNPLPAAPSAPTNLELSTLPWANWSIPLEDTEFLKELTPYLIWGNYDDPLSLEYAQIGWADLISGGSVYCYVQYGKLPLDLLEMIPYHADIDAPYSYEAYDIYDPYSPLEYAPYYY